MQDSVRELIKLAQQLRAASDEQDLLVKRQATLRERYLQWTTTRPADEVLPPVADIVFSAHFFAEMYETRELHQEHLESAQVEARFELVSKDWSTVVLKHLINLVSSADNNEPASYEDLSLATTFFRRADPKTKCREVLSFPRVMSHRCLCSPSALPPIPHRERFDYPRKYLREQYEHLKRAPWNSAHSMIAYDKDSAALVRWLCAVCSLNPDTTTAAELDELNARFVYVYRKRRRAGTWRAMVQDCRSLRSRAPADILAYVRASPEDETLIKENEKSAEILTQTDRAMHAQSCWYCRICQRRDQTTTYDKLRRT